jgi:Transposase IS116/IS110/IS902 family
MMPGDEVPVIDRIWNEEGSVRHLVGRLGDPSGDRTRRGSITKAGSEPVRTALVEAAWAYRFKPAIGVTLRRRQRDAEPGTLSRSWKAQRHLHLLGSFHGEPQVRPRRHKKGHTESRGFYDYGKVTESHAAFTIMVPTSRLC